MLIIYQYRLEVITDPYIAVIINIYMYSPVTEYTKPLTFIIMYPIGKL